MTRELVHSWNLELSSSDFLFSFGSVAQLIETTKSKASAHLVERTDKIMGPTTLDFTTHDHVLYTFYVYLLVLGKRMVGHFACLASPA